MISKSMHFGRKLPGRGPFSRIRRKRDACGAILASYGPGADATREGDAGGGARWARWERCARWGRCGRDFPMATTWTTILDLLDGDIEGRGQPGAARRRWRRSGRRAGARAVGRIRGRGARGIVGLVGRATARSRDEGRHGGASWEQAAAQDRSSVGAGRGPDGVGKRASVDAMHRRGRQLFAQAGKHRRNALLQRFDELLVHFEHLL